jgi:hypothetical protein
MSTLIERAEAALQLWENTPGVIIEVTYGRDAAEEAYRKAPELVGELVAALKELQRAELLKFAYWMCEGEFGEGHEEEIVDKYIVAGPHDD